MSSEKMNMRKLVFIKLFFLSCLFIACSPLSKNNDASLNHEKKQSANFISVNGLRQYEEKKLKNGLSVIYIKDSSLPRVGLQLGISAGSAVEDVKEYGVASLTASLLETGTIHRTAKQVVNDFAQLGSSFNQSMSEDFIVLSTAGLSQYSDRLVDLFSEVVLSPKFTAEELTRKKFLFLARIAKEQDDPGGYANLLINREIFKDHPYAHSFYGEKETVENIGLEQIKAFYKRFFHPEISILVVTGDVSDSMRKKIEDNFSRWQSKSNVPKVNIPDHLASSGMNLKIINRAGLEQSQIRIGTPSVARNHPDFMAMRIANLILGGEFASRLNQHIRDDLGLTYSIASQLDVQKYIGSFQIATFTRHEKLSDTVIITMQDLRKFINQGVSEKELVSAKSFLSGQFPLAIETVDRFGYQLLLLRNYGVDDSYLSLFRENLSKITVDQVNQAIRKHLAVDQWHIVIYTDESKVKSQLDKIRENIY